MHDIKSHQRVNDILLGPLERSALKWLSAHMPAWMTPDKLTAIGVVGALLCLAGYGFSNFDPRFLWLASFGFFVNWFGDSLDGTLARYRHVERPKYGFYIDHTTDIICQLLIFLGLGLSPDISFEVAILTLVGYLMLSVLVYVRTCVVGEFKLSYGKLGPTELRVFAVMLNTAMYFFGKSMFEFAIGPFRLLSISLYDIPVAVIGLLLLGFFLTTWIKQIRLLRVLDQPGNN